MEKKMINKIINVQLALGLLQETRLLISLKLKLVLLKNPIHTILKNTEMGLL